MPVMGPVQPRLLLTDLDVPEPMEVDDSAEQDLYAEQAFSASEDEDEGNHESANGDGNLEDFAEQDLYAEQDFSASEDEDEGNHESANGDGDLEDFAEQDLYAEQAFSAHEDEDDQTGYSADDEWGIEDEDDLAILIVPMSALRRAMKAA